MKFKVEGFYQKEGKHVVESDKYPPLAAPGVVDFFFLVNRKIKYTPRFCKIKAPIAFLEKADGFRLFLPKY